MLVAAEWGKCCLINDGVRLGLVVSSSLQLSAMRNVADGREQRHWKNVAGLLGSGGCGINIDGKCGDGFGSRTWAYCLVVGNVGEGHHPQASVGALVATHDCAAVVYDGAVDFGEGDHESGIAHCDNREDGV